MMPVDLTKRVTKFLPNRRNSNFVLNDWSHWVDLAMRAWSLSREIQDHKSRVAIGGITLKTLVALDWASRWRKLRPDAVCPPHIIELKRHIHSCPHHPDAIHCYEQEALK